MLRIGGRGDGVAETPAGRLYLPLTVPGDRVRAWPGTSCGDGRAAEVIEVIAAGPDRAPPPCPHFGRCGGCSLQHLVDAAYAAWKRERLTVALARAGFFDTLVSPLVRTPVAARRRATFAAVRPRRSGAAMVLGFNVRAGHDVVDLAVCPVLDPRIVDLLPALRDLLTTVLAPGGRSRVAVLLVDTGLDVMLEGSDPPGLAERELLAAFAAERDLARLSWRRPEDAAAEPIARRRPVMAMFGGIAVEPPPWAFLQASAEGERALVAEVVAAAGAAPAVADLFAGVGTFALPLAAAGVRVHAVDVNREALAALATAIVARAVPGVTTEARDLFRRPLSVEELRRFGAVVFDPPRAGARIQAEQLARSSVPVVVAVSCDPDTFVRDARILAAGGYRLVRAVPIDQFLWSPHLELAAVFRR